MRSNQGDSWDTQVIVYSALYDKTSALDLRFAGGETGPVLKIGKTRVGIKAFAGAVELGNTQYMDIKGLKIPVSQPLAPDMAIKATLKYEEKNYSASKEKNAYNTGISAALSTIRYDFLTRLGLRIEQENAKDNTNSFTRYGTNLSLVKKLPFDIIGSIKYDYQVTRYQETSVLFTESRKDKQHTAGCTFKRQLWKSESSNRNLTFDLNLSHVWAFSTVELYEYRKGLVQCFLTYNF